MGKAKQKVESSMEEGAKDYKKTGFVVDSDEGSGKEAQKNNDESYNDELSDDDLILIEENRRMQRQGRLKKIAKIDNEPEMEDVHEDLFQEPQSEEPIDENEQIELINKLFDPSQREVAFLNQNDEDIIKQDVPESIQNTYMMMTNGQIMQSAREGASVEQLKWIGEKMCSQFDIKNLSDVLVGIKLILEFYRKENLDIMYIYTYKRYLITSALQLEHYWKIRELDYEWEHFYNFKSRISKLIDSLPGKYQIQKDTANMYLQKAKEVEDLQNLKDCIDYIILKNNCRRIVYLEQELERVNQEKQLLGERMNQDQTLEQEQASFNTDNIVKELQNLSLNAKKKPHTKEKAMQEFFKQRVDEAALKFCYTSDELFSKLQGKSVQVNRKFIQDLEELWSHQANTTEFKSQDSSAEYVKLLQKYLMNELYHHPFIRSFMSQIYRDHLLISTEPTQLGNKEITAVSYFYPVKRIRHRQYKYMEDQTWMQCLRAEQLGYINISFTVSKDKDHKKEKIPRDDIMVLLYDKFVKIDDQQKEQESIMRFRDLILRGILQELWYPILEKQIKQKLQTLSTKHIVRMCQQKFKSLINKQPHISELANNQLRQQLITNPDVKIMSLVIGQEQSDGKLLKTYSQDCSIQKKCIGMAIIDYKGEQQSLQIFNYLTQDERRTEMLEQIRKEQVLLDSFFEKYKPDLVVISANHSDCLKLRADLRKKYKQTSSVQITLADSQISRIYSMSEKSNLQSPDTPQILKEAISLARYKLNPMAEVLNLWSDAIDKNGCLHLNLHPLQSMVSQQVLLDALKQTATEIVNQVGVDLVDCTLHKHLADQMQFVNGLGRRQAKHLITMVKGLLSKSLFNNNYEDERLIYSKLEQDQKEYIQIERQDILKTQILKKVVFKNVQGFIKIQRGIQPLDITRMQIKMYSDAVHIARCALEVGGRDDKQNTVVRQLMSQPHKMEDLQLEDWAKQRELRDGSEKFTLVAQFMKEELANPFLYKFDTSNKDMSNSEIFYAITQESPYTFRKNSVVQGLITKKLESRDRNKDGDRLLIKLSNNGLCGTLRKEDMLEQEFGIGQIVKAYVKRIPATENYNKNESLNISTLENNNKTDNFHILFIELSLKPDWQRWDQDYLKPPKYDPWPYTNIYYDDYCNKVLQTFDQSKFKEFDQPTIPQDQMPNRQRQQQKLILRNINHPKFKQVLLNGALEYLESQPVGEYIIRPNQKLKDHLNITWKFHQGVIVHLYVQELKSAQSYKPQLVLNGKTYESFNEIFENYITPCNLHMEAAINNKKFYNMKMEQVEQKLKEDKEKDEEIIPYGFCVTEKAPQHIVLLYMMQKNKVEKEYIKVKPEGLSFHSVMQNNLQELTLWFKQNFRTQEYNDYVKKNKPPILETNDKSNELTTQWEVKKEQTKEEKVKYEESSYNVICSRCNKRGHNANDCRQMRDKGRCGAGDSRMSCHNCGQNGHFKKNCPKLNNLRRERSHSRDREKMSTKKNQFQNKVEYTHQFGW
ncbi:unnamed protein product (macronuclear) [Paramecium tetraurelia]|uniref:CCHC-type domain-containing protein n=1 Tax=Paramecium tetraurelia TaxID=5888 RepID=A0DQ53_PARTE|nr:uncharacterized protein GSPATT00002570001 [Paramecium tetraurelia]CAK85170.1 unnamed protein product [Paramecium tetraurelia]|eukprot:XP_001452567.1 hypothetical protein (macronuclear) [Paramecium tetraurelia strain d4-2]